MGGGKGRKSQTIGYRYFMTIHMGIARGPIDEVTEIKVGDKTAWPISEGKGGQTRLQLAHLISRLSFGSIFESILRPLFAEPELTDTGTSRIDAGDLFGGDKKEGGVSGSLTAQMGKPDQIFPQWVKDLMGGNVPDFRGVTTLVFDGMICAMNPYPKAWKIRVRRTDKGWDGPVWSPDLVAIWLEDGKIKAMNPAHILYEAATNRDWGRGLDRTLLDEAKWRSAAETLYNEKFGLCIRWNRQDSLQSFVQQILDHIGGTIYTDRSTGLLVLDLIRDDYDPEELISFDYNSGLLSIEEGETISFESVPNEVVVKYHDVILNEEREIRAQNLASIQSLGSLNSSSVSYPGVATLDLASRLAQRDLRATTASGRRYKLKLDRRAWRIHPGAVFRISAPDKGIGNLVLRAGRIRPGSLVNGEIEVDAVVDVFGLSATAFLEYQETYWEAPPIAPEPILHAKVREAMYLDVFNSLGPADLAIVNESSGTIATIAAKPVVSALSYEIATKTVGDEFTSRNNESFAPLIILSQPVSHYQTVLHFDDSVDLGLVFTDGLIEFNNEVMRVDDITVDAEGTSGTITVTRGCYDTIPTTHTVGSKGFFITDNVGTDGIEYVIGDVVQSKLLTIMSSDTLDESLASTITTEIIGRQSRPYPPGNVTVGGIPCFSATTISGNFRIAWAHRDRKVQQDYVVGHFEGDIGPEPGTYYRISVYSGSTTTLLQVFDNITTNYLDFNSPSLTGDLRFELETFRGTITAFTKYVFNLNRL